MAKVKCADCGFLAIRNLETRELVEVEADFRKFGHPIGVLRAFPATQIGKTGFLEQDRYFAYIHDEVPICFKGIYNSMFWVINYKNGKDATTDQSVIAMLNKVRPCDEFAKWKQGFTPKEHQEMINRHWLIANENKRVQEDREWRERQRKVDLKWREEQEEKAESRHRTDLIIIGIIATLLICTVTIMAAFIERGSLFP